MVVAQVVEQSIPISREPRFKSSHWLRFLRAFIDCKIYWNDGERLWMAQFLKFPSKFRNLLFQFNSVPLFPTLTRQRPILDQQNRSSLFLHICTNMISCKKVVLVQTCQLIWRPRDFHTYRVGTRAGGVNSPSSMRIILWFTTFEKAGWHTLQKMAIFKFVYDYVHLTNIFLKGCLPLL